MFGKKKKYNILVLGNNGMLGYELYQRLIKLSLINNSNIGTVIGLDVKDGFDITNQNALGNFFIESIHFDYCINCIAYTDTKSAETTSNGRELDYKLNALAPKYIAESCKYWKTKLIHISTDYVFSEKSPDAAWYSNNSPLQFKEDSIPFPCNIYGYDKLLGEINIKEVFGNKSKDYCIMRVSWLYGNHNHKSFVHKFIANLIKSVNEGKTEIEMTSNEYSIPTSCEYVVESIINVINEKIYGIYHAVPTCSNESSGVSRFEFAEHILKFLSEGDYCTSEKDYINFSDIKLAKVERDSYWPKYSVLKTSAKWTINWKDNLNNFLHQNINDIIEWAKIKINN